MYSVHVCASRIASRKEHGVWSMEHGVWSMAHGAWSMRQVYITYINTYIHAYRFWGPSREVFGWIPIFCYLYILFLSWNYQQPYKNGFIRILLYTGSSDSTIRKDQAHPPPLSILILIYITYFIINISKITL